MADSPGATSAAATAPAFPARIGALLASPARALAQIEARGGGAVTDVAILIAVGTLCFRAADLSRVIAGIGSTSILGLLQLLLTVFSQELQNAIPLALIAGLAITILAGRGRRDPAVDIELGSACYIPVFAGQSLLRTIELDVLLGPLPSVLAQIAGGLTLAWGLAVLAVAVRLARRRPSRLVPAPAQEGQPAVTPPSAEPTRDRVAGSLVAAVLGGALCLSVAGVVRQGRGAPDFVLPRVDGQAGSVALANLRGKVVLLDFWATWCAPCQHMMPILDELYREWSPRGVEFVGINSDGPVISSEELRAFVRERQIPYPVVVDDGEVGGRYRVAALPHIVVVGRDGAIRRTFWGATRRQDIARALGQAAN